jgi:hypothetical protein
MCTAKQYRVKAAKFTELLKTASSPAEMREFRNLEQSYVTLAENENGWPIILTKQTVPGRTTICIPISSYRGKRKMLRPQWCV